MIVKTLYWSCEEATAQHAHGMAERLLALQPAAQCHIHLVGELGSGKTTWVRHLLQAMGVAGRIKSPTYAVLEPYTAQTRLAEVAIWHFDFYRFTDPHEWEDAGFRDVFASTGLKLCEWPAHAQGALPQPDLTLNLRLAPADGSRQADWQAHTPVGEQLLA